MSNIQTEPLPQVGGTAPQTSGAPAAQPKTNTGSRARSAAVKRLQEAHPQEWDKFHKEERVRIGLPPIPTTGLTEAQKKEQKIARLKSQLAELEK